MYNYDKKVGIDLRTCNPELCERHCEGDYCTYNFHGDEQSCGFGRPGLLRTLGSTDWAGQLLCSQQIAGLPPSPPALSSPTSQPPTHIQAPAPSCTAASARVTSATGHRLPSSSRYHEMESRSKFESDRLQDGSQRSPQRYAQSAFQETLLLLFAQGT